MKITAKLSETGRLVSAANDADWAEVHGPPTGTRPALYCPDKSDGCRNSLHPVERSNRSKGTTTRFFRFSGESGQSCDHEEVDRGVEVQASGGGGVESGEHVWLKDYVAGIARKAGYSPELEARLESGVRADVFIPTAHRGRVELQRVATNIPARTEEHPDVIWLLREQYSHSTGNKRALFGYPCTQVRITALVVAADGTRDWPPAEPWRHDFGTRPTSVKASSTVLTRSTDPVRALVPRRGKGGKVTMVYEDQFFRTQPMPLRDFLTEVWSGDRQWYPKGRIHKFAGWAHRDDVARYFQWKRTLQVPIKPSSAPIQVHPVTPVVDSLSQETNTVSSQPNSPNKRGRADTDDAPAGVGRGLLSPEHFEEVHGETADSIADFPSDIRGGPDSIRIAATIPGRRSWWNRTTSWARRR